MEIFIEDDLESMSAKAGDDGKFLGSLFKQLFKVKQFDNFPKVQHSQE